MMRQRREKLRKGGKDCFDTCAVGMNRSPDFLAMFLSMQKTTKLILNYNYLMYMHRANTSTFSSGYFILFYF